MSTMLLSELAGRLSAQLIGDAQRPITGVNTVKDAAEGHLCFLLSDKYADDLAQSRASAVLLQKPRAGCAMAQLVVQDVQQSLIAALRLFAPKIAAFEGIHPSAFIDASACIDPSAAVGPWACIAAGVRIGASSSIGPNCFLGQDTEIGRNCRLDAGVVIYHNCRIGDHCILQANATIGAVGFGYYCINGRHELIPHNGGVILGDYVEIGANSCVDRAKFGNTVIGAGTKIDNLVMVAHNVQIGQHCLLAGQAAIAGSTRLGNYVVMGGRAGVTDNITIGDQVMMGLGSLATADVEKGARVYGYPAQDLQNELKCIAAYQKLPELVKELRQLRKKIKQLEAAKNDKK